MDTIEKNQNKKNSFGFILTNPKRGEREACLSELKLILNEEGILSIIKIMDIFGDEEYYEDMFKSIHEYVKASAFIRQMKQKHSCIDPWNEDYQKAKETILKFIKEVMSDLCWNIEDR